MNTLEQDPRPDLANDATELCEWARRVASRLINEGRRRDSGIPLGTSTRAHSLKRQVESGCMGAWYSGNSVAWREARLTVAIDAAAHLGRLAMQFDIDVEDQDPDRDRSRTHGWPG